MNHSKQLREMYNVHRQRTCKDLGITVNQYNQFRRLGQYLNTIYTNQCNGYYDVQKNTWNRSAELLEEQLEQENSDKAREMALKLELHIYFQTDPRGATIYLDRKPIERDRYTDAYCIY